MLQVVLKTRCTGRKEEEINGVVASALGADGLMSEYAPLPCLLLNSLFHQDLCWIHTLLCVSIPPFSCFLPEKCCIIYRFHIYDSSDSLYVSSKYYLLSNSPILPFHPISNLNSASMRESRSNSIDLQNALLFRVMRAFNHKEAGEIQILWYWLCVLTRSANLSEQTNTEKKVWQDKFQKTR